jgi:hypothetical protein
MSDKQLEFADLSKTDILLKLADLSKGGILLSTNDAGELVAYLGEVTLYPGWIEASASVRNAAAQERIATAMEKANELLAEGRQQLVAGATVGEGPTKTVLNAHMMKGGTHIDIQMDFTNPVKAATFFDDFMDHLKRMVDEAEGGPANV